MIGLKNKDKIIMNQVIALLPMKRNSNRIKDKNLKFFFGRPLYKWILDTLLSIKIIDKVIINTDAREILTANGLIENNRLIIKDRNKQICGDSVSMNTIIQDDLTTVDGDLYLMTHTTNPLLSSETILKALKSFQTEYKCGKVDSLFTVNKVQARFYNSDGHAINHNPSELIPTQNIEPWFEENSNLYIFTKESFSKNKSRIGKNPMLFETSVLESIDIDNPDDWVVAEALCQYYFGGK